MCFGAKTPAINQPAPPPTQRDANLEGVDARRRAAASAKTSGMESTIATSAGGVSGSAPILKSTLGG